MADITYITPSTDMDLPPNRILEAAMDKLDVLIIIGTDKNGELYFASSTGESPEVLWLMEKAKLELLSA